VNLLGSEGRKDVALLSVIGGGMVMSVYAMYAMWSLQAHPGFIFYLGMAAMVQILIIFTGILGLLVKRNLSVSKDNITIGDLVHRDTIEEVPSVDSNKPS
jgi:hypothetical protein